MTSCCSTRGALTQPPFLKLFPRPFYPYQILYKKDQASILNIKAYFYQLSMPEITQRDSILVKFTGYLKSRTRSTRRRTSTESYEKSGYEMKPKIGIWDLCTSDNSAKHTFIPGTFDAPLKGRCSMIKITVKEKTGHCDDPCKVLTIFGRTDLICESSAEVTHANWRKDIPVPYHVTQNKVKCVEKGGSIAVSLDLTD